MLSGPGCPACRAEAEAEDRWVESVIFYLYADARFQDRLRRSLGYCARHLRRLAFRSEAPWILRAGYAELADEALRRLDAGDLAHHALQPCPGCEAAEGAIRRAVATMLGAWDRAEVADAYRSGGGFCYPHLVVGLGLSRAEARTTRAWLEIAAERLSACDGPDLSWVAGADRDVWLRQRIRSVPLAVPSAPAALPAPRRSRAGVRGWLHELLEAEACPVCAVRGAMEERYLAWLRGEDHGAGGPGTDAVWLCSVHLHDLEADRPSGDAPWYRWQVGQLVQRIRLALGPAELPGWRMLPAAWLGRVRARVAGALPATLGVLPGCAACRAVAVAERRQRQLLAAALRDPDTLRRFRRSHGLCYRDAVAGVPSAAGPVVRRTLRARIELLAWELEEMGRKAAWAARHEVRGDEGTAWIRMLGQFDGRVFLGRPARSVLPLLGAEAGGREP